MFERIRRILTREPDDRAVVQLSLDEYLSVVRELPPPSGEQMEAFSRFVAGAHSWYKHLPYAPPGSPFQFFLDPSAGMQREITRGGGIRVVPRHEQGFQRSWIPTREYRERFGYLAFSRSAGTVVTLGTNGGGLLVPSDDDPRIYDPRCEYLAALPPEVLDAGRMKVTAAVHAHPQPALWLHRIGQDALEHWPEESGGEAGIEKILDYCREWWVADRRRDPYLSFRRIRDLSDPLHKRITQLYNERFFDHFFERQDRLVELIAPERTRQLRGMAAAMQRVCDLGAGPPKTRDEGQ